MKRIKKLYVNVIKQKGFNRKLKYLHFFNLARKNGVVGFRRYRIASEYCDDYYADTGIHRHEKEWFYRRGIPSFKVRWYGLTKENYNNYISDFDFYNKRNYRNGQFENWFEHKLNTYYLLLPFKEYMPIHYYYVHERTISPLDVAKKTEGSVDDIISLIREQPIAAKACVGGHGRGFYKISILEDDGCNPTFSVNGQEKTKPELEELINGFYSYIITEYGIPHKVFRNLCGEDAFAVMRAVTAYDPKSGGHITALMIRLGCKKSGYVTDYDGTIYCGIDLEDGHLFTPIQRSGDTEGIIKRTNLTVHPDTGIPFNDITVPNFNELKSLLKNISEFISITPYLVMDIIPTDDGFEILEINSHGQVRNVEPFYPFRKNPYNLKVFNTKDR